MSSESVGMRISLVLIGLMAMTAIPVGAVTASNGTPSPVTAVKLTANPPGPQPSGTPVVFTAAASGGSGTYEYSFWGRPAGAPAWSPLQGYSTRNSCTWRTSSVFLGSYEIKVDARNVGSTALSEASQTITYVVTTPGGAGSR